MKSNTHLTSIVLIGGGAACLAFTAKPLVTNKEADVPLNILGFSRSPYGEVVAMAVQGPIDTFFHAAESGSHVCADPEHCNHTHAKSDEILTEKSYSGWNERMRMFVESLGDGLQERTNPTAAGEGHKFYLRRQIEDKLRFAYNLDPSHYGNYNTYHFFLTEPALGTRPVLTPKAAKLAHETIVYCLNQRSDPRQALTAAAAAGNILELMFNERRDHPDSTGYSTSRMKEILAITDQAIGLYGHLSDQWEREGLWENLSELRLQETAERLRFILKVRESQEAAIRRLDGGPADDRSGAVSQNHQPTAAR